MEIYDGHIHTHGKPCDPPEVFLEKAYSCGILGGTIFSVHPAKYRPFPDYDQRPESRLDWILEYTSHTPGFIPYFFIDISEPDALRQVECAKKAGIRGFKIICDGNYSVGDHLEVMESIAETGLPVMFHSGVDYIQHLSSENNMPIKFEPLLHIKGLRFSLAHIGWPWCDDFIGTLAKFQFARGGMADSPFADMYADITPGTPGIYRREALRKLYLTGLDVKPRVFWGTDCVVNNYNPALAKRMIDRDVAIIEEIERDAANGVVTDPYGMPVLTGLKEPLFAGVWKEFNSFPSCLKEA